jgi:hypothetical protein
VTPDFISTKIVGLTFNKDYPSNVFALSARVATGRVPIDLIREKDNQYDANAIAVVVDGKTIGHVPRLIAAVLAPDMDAGSAWNAHVESIAIATENPQQPGVKMLLWKVNYDN